MENIRHFSLSQLAELLSNNEIMLHNYISQHLAIARILDVNLFKQIASIPLVINELRVLLVKKGHAAASVNLMEKRYEKGDLVFIHSNSIIMRMNVSDDLEGIGLSISDELFYLSLNGQLPKTFDGHLRDFSVRLSEPEMEFIDKLHFLIYESTKPELSNSQLTFNLTAALLWSIDTLHNRYASTIQSSLSREQKLFADFLQLVSKHTPLERNIDFYASNLFLSTRYMSHLIKKHSGKSAKEWIDEATILKIKTALRHTDKPVNQIAEEMGFNSPSFFCKYFRNLTSKTPLEYRNEPEKQEY